MVCVVTCSLSTVSHRNSYFWVVEILQQPIRSQVKSFQIGMQEAGYTFMFEVTFSFRKMWNAECFPRISSVRWIGVVWPAQVPLQKLHKSSSNAFSFYRDLVAIFCQGLIGQEEDVKAAITVIVRRLTVFRPDPRKKPSLKIYSNFLPTVTHVFYSHVMQIHANFCVPQVNTYGVKVRSFIPTRVGVVISEIFLVWRCFQ